MTVTVDTSQFSAMCRELAKKLQAPPERVLREEIGRVLSRAIELTPAADKSKIEAHSRNAVATLQPAGLYAPKRPGRRHLKKGRVLYDLNKFRYPNALWQAILTARAADLKKRIKARGLAKQSWLRIAMLQAFPVDAPGYVRSAVATTGKQYPQDEKVDVARSNGNYSYTIENSQPTINAIDGEIILARAVNGRVSYFLKNIEKEVFTDLKKIATKYPGVT
jgi:hypothetical protein